MGLYFKLWNERGSDSNTSHFDVMDSAAINTKACVLAVERSSFCQYHNLTLPRQICTTVLQGKAFFFLEPSGTDADGTGNRNQFWLTKLLQGWSDGVTQFLPPGVTWGMAAAAMPMYAGEHQTNPYTLPGTVRGKWWLVWCLWQAHIFKVA